MCICITLGQARSKKELMNILLDEINLKYFIKRDKVKVKEEI